MESKVLVFGSGDCGQLGLGEDINLRKRPTSIKYLEDKKIIDICAGGLHTLALGQDGKVYSWGCNDEKALGRGGEEYEAGPVENLEKEFVVQVAAGDSISAALTSEGKVYTWGTFRDSKGVLGFSTNSMMQEQPTLLEGLGKERVTAISAGANHMIAVTESHKLFAWGCGEQGQLGRRILERHKTHGLVPSNITPKRKRGAEAASFSQVSCGSYHSLAVTSDNRAYSWGFNNYGQLGQGDFAERVLPELIESDARFVQVAAGEHHSIALDIDGHVHATGRGDSGQLGSGAENSTEFVKMAGLGQVVMIASGGNHNLAVTKDNEVFSWGYGGMLQLGNGEEEDLKVPTKIPNMPAGIVKKVQGGGQHTVILISSK